MPQRNLEQTVLNSIIKDGKVVSDDWLVVGLETGVIEAQSSKKILPLEDYLTQGHGLLGEPGQYAVWLNSGDDIEQHIELLLGLPLIAIYFPSFADGRGFSMATLLRERYGYQGELRAIGHMLTDQLYYLSRCGFSSFQFADEVNLNEALQSLRDFSDSYQPGAN